MFLHLSNKSIQLLDGDFCVLHKSRQMAPPKHRCNPECTQVATVHVSWVTSIIE